MTRYGDTISKPQPTGEGPFPVVFSTYSVIQSAGYRFRFPTKIVVSPMLFYCPPTKKTKSHNNNLKLLYFKFLYNDMVR